jgi:hypothetical protein
MDMRSQFLKKHEINSRNQKISELSQKIAQFKEQKRSKQNNRENNHHEQEKHHEQPNIISNKQKKISEEMLKINKMVSNNHSNLVEITKNIPNISEEKRKKIEEELLLINGVK